MKRKNSKSVTVILAVSAALGAAAANATDSRMWRTQVARPADSVILIESRPVDPGKKYGNDSLLWREQVDIAPTNRLFILEPSPRSAAYSDSRLWREQIQTDASRSKVSVSGHQQPTGTARNQ